MRRYIRRGDSFTEVLEVAKTYEAISEGYKHWRSRYWRISEIARGRIILDLGSGPCENGVYVAEIKKSYVLCLDISESMTKIAREKLFDKEVFGDSLQADMRYLPLRESSIDTVLAIASIHHIPIEALENVLREVSRVLRRGGFLIATIWSWRQSRFLIKIFVNMIRTLLGLIDYPRRIIVPWRRGGVMYKRIYYLYNEKEIREAIRNVKGLKPLSIGYVGRYRSDKSDNLYFIAVKT